MELFSDTFLPSGLAEPWFATQGCPACGRVRLEPVTSGPEPHWTCGSCGRCYRARHGVLQVVDPITCGGCARRDRMQCIEWLSGRFPAFTVPADER
jgi:hypothetical protein